MPQPRRVTRYEGMSDRQMVNLLADDIDALDSKFDELEVSVQKKLTWLGYQMWGVTLAILAAALSFALR